jgi:hypothetical protein
VDVGRDHLIGLPRGGPARHQLILTVPPATLTSALPLISI